MIRFQGDAVELVSMTSLKSWQRKYALDTGNKTDEVVVPASQDNIFYGFHVQYCDEMPTHKLCWFDDSHHAHAYFQPIKSVSVGEEFSFTYSGPVSV